MTKKPENPRLSRRSFAAGTAAGAAALALGFPAVLRAQPAAVKMGLIHPVTGFLQFSGTQCRFGAVTAVEEINAEGGIKSLGGASNGVGVTRTMSRACLLNASTRSS